MIAQGRQDRDKWRELVNNEMHYRDPQN